MGGPSIARRAPILSAERVRQEAGEPHFIRRNLEADGSRRRCRHAAQPAGDGSDKELNVRDVPNTDGLQQQRKLSLPVPERWWLDVLHRGYVFRSKLGLEADLGKWLPDVSTELLFASYEEFAKQAHERRLMSREALGKFMVEMRAVPKRLSNATRSASTSPTLRTCGAALSGRRRSFEAPGRQVTVSAACNFRVRIFARSLASPFLEDEDDASSLG